MSKEIYFDNAATTKLKQEVLDEMLPYLKNSYGNASSVYSLGRESRKALEDSREKVATIINAKKEEIFFTSSGTESDNWAIKGVAYANREKGKHIITTNIEHHAVLDTCKYLEKNGFEVTYVSVKEDGIVRVQDIQEAIREDTILISVMYANNEIGTIQPIKEIAQIAREREIYFHTDAVQVVGHLPVDIIDLGVDLLSFSAHKFNGPKGVGSLFIKNGVKVDNLLHGGGQERGRRPSTENIAGIVGLAKALELSTKDLNSKKKYLEELREYTIDNILKKIPESIVNGHRDRRLPGNVNVCFKYIEGESILLMLDQLYFCASSGSACTSGSLDPSHVLLAIGLPHEIAHGSLRISFSEENTYEEVDKLLEELPKIVEKLRAMSPLFINKK